MTQTMRSCRGWGRQVVLALAFTWATTAGAQGPSEADKAAARALFDAGRQLVSDGKYAEACPKFEESHRLDPGVGTLFNLANCYENVGKTATAWSLFRDVAAQLRTTGEADREATARQRAARLEPLLSRLTVEVPQDARIEGLVVRRDGTELGSASWGTAIPLDPGPYLVEASAPGYKEWKQSVEVAKGGATARVLVPVLESEAVEVVPAAAPVRESVPVQEPAPPQEATRAPEPPTVDTGQSDGSGQRLAGLVVGGVGVVGLGVGTVLGLGAKSTFDESSDHCVDNRCSDEGLSLRDDAVKQGNVATVVFGLGAAAVVGGAVLYFTAPSAQGESAGTASVGFGPGSLWVKGAW